ncbi:hypothetical protein CXG81DRAFT_16456 [Caulochytrium protostelioides]|uniref:Uncharacterized protein n=1 Tax=Caulochytrium protostelioides TaxID=1555241 RepID=A0A4V1IVH0_9FUNG|nr:hypothetical protein CXG81DRAFT_16456 [Caulochytrium protostelioides]|eukprot:RKP04029.1 hypothetical protein CXG81DRAFT_16456 [Caulochytrium protostelioides]
MAGVTDAGSATDGWAAMDRRASSPARATAAATAETVHPVSPYKAAAVVAAAAAAAAAEPHAGFGFGLDFGDESGEFDEIPLTNAADGAAPYPAAAAAAAGPAVPPSSSSAAAAAASPTNSRAPSRRSPSPSAPPPKTAYPPHGHLAAKPPWPFATAGGRPASLNEAGDLAAAAPDTPPLPVSTPPRGRSHSSSAALTPRTAHGHAAAAPGPSPPLGRTHSDPPSTTSAPGVLRDRGDGHGIGRGAPSETAAVAMRTGDLAAATEDPHDRALGAAAFGRPGGPGPAQGAHGDAGAASGKKRLLRGAPPSIKPHLGFNPLHSASSPASAANVPSQAILQHQSDNHLPHASRRQNLSEDMPPLTSPHLLDVEMVGLAHVLVSRVRALTAAELLSPWDAGDILTDMETIVHADAKERAFNRDVLALGASFIQRIASTAEQAAAEQTITPSAPVHVRATRRAALEDCRDFFRLMAQAAQSDPVYAKHLLRMLQGGWWRRDDTIRTVAVRVKQSMNASSASSASASSSPKPGLFQAATNGAKAAASKGWWWSRRK